VRSPVLVLLSSVGSLGVPVDEYRVVLASVQASVDAETSVLLGRDVRARKVIVGAEGLVDHLLTLLDELVLINRVVPVAQIALRAVDLSSLHLLLSVDELAVVAGVLDRSVRGVTSGCVGTHGSREELVLVETLGSD